MPRPAARVGIPVQNLFYRFRFVGRRFTNYSFNCRWNIVKTECAIQERRHRHLVCRVEGNGLSASCFDGFVGQS